MLETTKNLKQLNKEIRLSVVMPTHNSAEYICSTMNAIEKQSFIDFELLIVDDDSNDNTLEIVKKYSENDNRISIYKSDGSGVSHARNIGINNAKGKYLIFIDSDDTIDQNFFQYMIEPFEKNSNDFDIICCKYDNDIDAKSQEIATHDFFLMDKLSVISEILMPNKNIASFVWNKAYKRSIIIKNNVRFNDKVFACEDTLFNYQYLKHCTKDAYVISSCLYHYRINDNGTMYNRYFNRKKISGNIAHDIILNDSMLNKEIHKQAIIGTMLYNLILLHQYRKNGQEDKQLLYNILNHLFLDNSAFLKANISTKYKIAFCGYSFLYKHQKYGK